MKTFSQKRSIRSRSQAGVALLVALFALLLLSAVGLGMMFSANSETAIGANYREVQTATFGAYSGLWEARDRLMYVHPATTSSLTLPSDIPTATGGNVIYIINPAAGETVAPWDYTNAYADTELCHENVLGLSGTAGVPCSGSASLPSGSSWYTTYNDSTYSGIYNLGSNPLPFKWVRVQLKTDNATPFGTSGSTTGNQVCWDGNNQVPDPAGYGGDCGPTPGGVATINITNEGSGYTVGSSPLVTIAAPPAGGTQATATATVTLTDTGALSGITVTAPGANYTTAGVVIDAPPVGGTQATATANVVASGKRVVNINSPTVGNSCYSGTPPTSVPFTPPSGSGTAATATEVVSGNTCIYNITLTGSCSSKKGNSNVSFSVGGPGSGFTGTVNFKNSNGGPVDTSTVKITNPGSGYSAAPTGNVTISGCTGTNAISIVTASLGYTVSNFNLLDGGGGYVSTDTPSVTAPGSTATQASGWTLTSAGGTLGGANPNAGQISSITLNNPGAGYTSTPNVTITGNGTGATATASMATTGKVTSMTITNGGSGYTSPPAITIAAPGGSGTTATAVDSLSYGTWLGQVFLITAMGRSPAGAHAMAQMEAVLPVRGFGATGALTLDGPSPTFSPPNSLNMVVNGNDLNSCGGVADPAHPAVGVFDDPNNPTTPTALASVTAAVDAAKPQNYIGSAIAPDIENIFGNLGDTMSTPGGLDALASAIQAVANANGTAYSNNPSNPALGTANNPVVDYVAGDVSFSGNVQGYGILLVTGTLNMGGNFSWNGVVLAIGKGVAVFNGGGNGQINGTIIAAKTRDSSGNLLNTLGSPSVTWTGGGGNGVHYDHCWVQQMMSRIDFTPPQSTKPLKIISVKTLAY